MACQKALLLALLTLREQLPRVDMILLAVISPMRASAERTQACGERLLIQVRVASGARGVRACGERGQRPARARRVREQRSAQARRCGGA